MEFTKDIQFNSSLVASQYTTITYTGFLKDSSELTIVYGFNKNWEHTTEEKMQKTKNGFTAKIKMLDYDTFNFCFRNAENVWDNNNNCNYISSILSYERSQKIALLFDELLAPLEEKPAQQQFDIDGLIEELLEPIVAKPIAQAQKITPEEINSNPVDLGLEISKVLSQITDENSPQDLVEYSTLDEILSGTVIEETPVELFEENALITSDDTFVISPRQLSRFYLFRKRLKLAFYKALVKIPKLIFGLEHE